MEKNDERKPQPKELPGIAADVLEGMLAHVGFDPEAEPRKYAIYRYGKRMVELARDMAFLEAHNKTCSTQLIARGLLESAFRFCLAAKEPNEAAQQMILDFEWTRIQQEIPGAILKEVAAIRKKPKYCGIGEETEELSEKWGYRREEYRLWERYSVSKWANKSGMRALYKSWYPVLCNDAHATVTSFVGVWATSFVLRVATVCLLEAAKQLMLRYGDEIPQELRMQAVVLRETHTLYEKNGAYEALVRAEAEGVARLAPEKPEERDKEAT